MQYFEPLLLPLLPGHWASMLHEKPKNRKYNGRVTKYKLNIKKSKKPSVFSKYWYVLNESLEFCLKKYSYLLVFVFLNKVHILILCTHFLSET
jgi:hypothetical protein